MPALRCLRKCESVDGDGTGDDSGGGGQDGGGSAVGDDDDAEDKVDDSPEMMVISEWLWYWDGDHIETRMVIDGSGIEMMKVLFIELGWECRSDGDDGSVEMAMSSFCVNFVWSFKILILFLILCVCTGAGMRMVTMLKWGWCWDRYDIRMGILCGWG